MTDACVLVFDSGLGGLSVLRSLQARKMEARFIYAADNAAFPYGGWQEDDLKRQITKVMGALIERYAPDVIVVACNTASTLVLEHLRHEFETPFVGTVPAIRVAAGISKTRVIGVLATPGTVKRGYTSDLVDQFAPDCHVVLCPCDRLAELAEAGLAGLPVDMKILIREIKPAFVSNKDGMTDVVVLACTHYPFLLKELNQAAPWPVQFIDPAPAIARRVVQVLADVEPAGGKARLAENRAVFTSQSIDITVFGQLLEEFELNGIDHMQVSSL